MLRGEDIELSQGGGAQGRDDNSAMKHRLRPMGPSGGRRLGMASSVSVLPALLEREVSERDG